MRHPCGLCGTGRAAFSSALTGTRAAALYEMFEADMPAHAQGAYVELAKEMVGPWCASFANGEAAAINRKWGARKRRCYCGW